MCRMQAVLDYLHPEGDSLAQDYRRVPDPGVSAVEGEPVS